MRVLLTQPPLVPGGPVSPPLGLCTLASWLLSRGHEVAILDLDLEVRARDSADPACYVPQLLRAIDEVLPDVVGVTSMYSNSLQAEHLVCAAKRYRPGIGTVVGGPHFGALGGAPLRRMPELDFAVQGEGELAFSALLDALHRGCSVSDIPSLCYRMGGEICVNGGQRQINLAGLSPMWTTLTNVIRLDRYAATIPEGARRRTVYIEAGRGCPFACTFCATAPFWRREYRVKPVERIVDEIRFLNAEFRYDSFILVHDLLTANQRFVSDFCDAMLETRLPVDWMANSRTDIRLHGLLPKMKAAGCWKLFLGVESASDRMQKAIDKHLDMGEVLETVTDLADHGISCTCSFVPGFPDERPEEVSSTIALGARLKLLGAETIQFHRLRLWPPARLTRSEIPVEFDLDSLRIEFPFLRVSDTSIRAIREGKDFFGGYFVPQSFAGSATQLAQVEMFFHHAVALAPLTIAALAQFAGGQLVPAFYAVLADCGPVDRGALDWESGGLLQNWRAVRPLLKALVSRSVTVNAIEGQIAEGLLEYEERRLHFISGVSAPLGCLAAHENWTAFVSSIDVPEVIRQLQTGGALTGALRRPIVVVLARQTGDSFGAYTLDPALAPELMRRDSEVLRALAPSHG